MSDTWVCPHCQTAMSKDDFERNFKVCGVCQYHDRLTWQERLILIADPGSFTEFDGALRSLNPIGFPDYEARIARLQEECETGEAILTGECGIQGYRALIGIMDSRFMMASMGSVVGEKICRVFEYGTERGLPVILFTASGGARMQEGIFSLMQMAKTSGAAARHSRAGQLYITVLTDPTTGGVTASFASLGDIIIAEPQALIGFAGKRVIRDTIGPSSPDGSVLPEGFQSAEFLQAHGFMDLIVSRGELRETLARLLRLHSPRGAAGKPEPRRTGETVWHI